MKNDKQFEREVLNLQIFTPTHTWPIAVQRGRQTVLKGKFQMLW